MSAKIRYECDIESEFQNDWNDECDIDSEFQNNWNDELKNDWNVAVVM